MTKIKGGIALALVVSLVAGVPRSALAAGPEASEPQSPADAASSDGEAAAAPPADAPRDPEAIRQEKRIEEAERHFIEGRTLYHQGRYLEAAAEFERSFAAIERAETLYNIVVSHELAGQPIPALRAAKKYLALPDCAGEETGMCAKYRQKVTAIERRVRPSVAELSLDLQRGVTLREIRVDGRVIPQQDFPLMLTPGRYDLELRGPEEGQIRAFVLELKPGQLRSVDVAPFPDDSDEGDAAVPRPPTGPDPLELEAQKRREERRRKALRASFYTGVGLTVAAGAATATFGALTLRAKRLHTEQMCEPDPDEPPKCNEPDYPGMNPGEPPFIERRAEFRRYEPITNAMIGVTAVLGVTTAIVGIFAFTGQGSRRGSQRYGLSPNGLVVRW